MQGAGAGIAWGQDLPIEQHEHLFGGQVRQQGLGDGVGGGSCRNASPDAPFVREGMRQKLKGQWRCALRGLRALCDQSG